MDSPLSDIRIGRVCYEWAIAQKLKSFHFPEIDSTNARAKAEAFNPSTLEEHLVLYFAEAQKAGRGRGQNTWSNSSPGSQLLSTWSFMLQDHVQPVLSPLVGLAVYKAAVATWPFLDFSLKAPNDVYIGEKKVAGLLIETISQGDDIRLLIGLGMNVLSAPAEVKTSGSLVQSLPKMAPLLAQDWITFLERFLFEVSIAIQLASEPLDTTAQLSLLGALNRFPLLEEKYMSIDEDANLETESKSISWSNL